MCDEFDATVASSDLLDPYALYKLPYYRSECDGTVIIDEKPYKKYRCWLDFNMFDTFDPECNFEYHFYYQLDGY
ncbi:MAG: hypothetical protein IJJ00_04540 [Erysipelotrichaceae bacterium]|nr:hypothetical protein [Erysipelotrichaceae bacterium]